ncbi:MAG: AAA family ATPase, partial [Bacteroidota bacterium]|nr:AAA family ATPase [Bacteroidota bacterium]
MEIRRNIREKLIAWKRASGRKPLILQGPRHVGKTWLLKHFGAAEFDQVAYFNFEEQPGLKQFFSASMEIGPLISNLSFVYGKAITPETTLIIFDEVQECNKALISLKYFCENAPEYAIACATSLLRVTMSKGNS